MIAAGAGRMPSWTAAGPFQGVGGGIRPPPPYARLRSCTSVRCGGEGARFPQSPPWHDAPHPLGLTRLNREAALGGRLYDTAVFPDGGPGNWQSWLALLVGRRCPLAPLGLGLPVGGWRWPLAPQGLAYRLVSRVHRLPEPPGYPSYDSPGRNTTGRVSPTVLTLATKSAGSCTSMGKVPQCMGMTTLGRIHWTAMAASSGPMV